MKRKAINNNNGKGEYHHLSQALIHLDKAIREMNYLEDPIERFTGFDGAPYVDLTDVENYAEGIRDEVLRRKKINKEAKTIPASRCRRIAQAVEFWQGVPDRLKVRLLKKENELEIINADTFDIELIFRKVRKTIQVFGHPDDDGRPDYLITDVRHDDLEDLDGILKKIENWKDEELGPEPPVSQLTRRFIRGKGIRKFARGKKQSR